MATGRTFLAVAVAAAFSAAAIGSASAGSFFGIDVKPQDGLTTTVTFDAPGPLPNDTPITTQFAAEQLTFSGSIRANSCGVDSWVPFGMSGNSLGTFGPGCQTNTTDDSFALKFARKLSRLSFRAFAQDDGNAGSGFVLRNEGAVVGTFTVVGAGFAAPYDSETGCFVVDGTFFCDSAGSTTQKSGFFNFGADAFDEIDWVEKGPTSYLFFDNLSFTAVPEPATALLLVAAAGGAVTLRRRRRR